MRAAVLALVAGLVAAGSVVALAIAIRADIRSWREWDDDPDPIVGMPTWPYRGEVN